MRRWPGAGPAAWLVLRACAAGAALAIAGCAQGPDHERLGDRRYAEHSFLDALAEYNWLFCSSMR
jgi:hypothetical protein